jgi:hypothetical protein
VIANKICNLKSWYQIKVLLIIFKTRPYSTYDSQNCAQNSGFKDYGGVLMEDFEDCMQLEVATSSYTNSLVSSNMLIFIGIGL